MVENSFGRCSPSISSDSLCRSGRDTIAVGFDTEFWIWRTGKDPGKFHIKDFKSTSWIEGGAILYGWEFVGNSGTEPFNYKFHTSDFEDGEREMYAEGTLADGTILESNHISKVFLSSDQAWGETQQLIVPILVGTAVLTLLGVGVPMLASKKKSFVFGKYGPAGGVVCPRCELPFSRSVFSPNLLAGKLVRCPHCGKVSILPRASSSSLQEAESRYTRKDEPGMIHHGKEDLQKQLEDSRFEE